LKRSEGELICKREAQSGATNALPKKGGEKQTKKKVSLSWWNEVVKSP